MFSNDSQIFAFNPMLTGSQAGNNAAKAITESAGEQINKNITNLINGMSRQQLYMISESGQELVLVEIPAIRYGSTPFTPSVATPFRVQARIKENTENQYEFYVGDGFILKSPVQNDFLTINGLNTWTDLTITGSSGNVWFNIPVTLYSFDSATVTSSTDLDLSAAPWTTGGIVEAEDNSDLDSGQNVLRILIATIDVSSGSPVVSQRILYNLRPRGGLTGILARAALITEAA